MSDDCSGANFQDSPRISDSRPVHSHIHYALMGTGLVGVVDEFELEAAFAVPTQVASRIIMDFAPPGGAQPEPCELTSWQSM